MQQSDAALFLFPHQDDEFGVFALLERNVREGVASLCIYLTDGGGNNVPPEVRDAESRRVLNEIGIPDEHVFCLKTQRGERVRDGMLVDAMPATLDALLAVLKGRVIGTIYTPAWEGGHPDHDAAALIAAAFAKQRNVKDVWQFSLYNSYRAGRFPFKTFNPIPSAGRVMTIPILMSSILRYARYCLAYRSQKTTFAALLPFVIYRLARDRYQSLQHVENVQFLKKPHQGDLLYERRGWLSWDDFDVRAASFMACVVGART